MAGPKCGEPMWPWVLISITPFSLSTSSLLNSFIQYHKPVYGSWLTLSSKHNDQTRKWQQSQHLSEQPVDSLRRKSEGVPDPGAEIIRGKFPETYIYRVAGVYDPAATQPNYEPEEQLHECRRCRATTLTAIDENRFPDTCPECGANDVLTVPYLRPPGFTVDAAIPDAGKEKYQSGGRERAGFTPSAQLLVGASAIASGTPNIQFAPELYSAVHVGDLFMRNMGSDRERPGFLLCPDCGRLLDPDQPGRHTYPAHVPPHRGRRTGPRAGALCPNTNASIYRAALGHKFASEVILLAVDMPSSLDAPVTEPSGKAAWYSFGTLI